jgi:hypothetical protein
MDPRLECVSVSEGPVGQMIRLEITPDDLDVIQIRRIFRQPLDSEPMPSMRWATSPNVIEWPMPVT